jgi:hypothetical protein
MSTSISYTCDGCGEKLATAPEFFGLHQGQTFVAAGQIVADWHACSAACAAKHLRAVADGVERRGAQLEAERKRSADHRARFAAQQAELRARGGVSRETPPAEEPPEGP